MKKHTITTSFTVYSELDELEASVRSLMEKAGEARDKAYAPYSKFRVGAAVLLENGSVVTGNNQENACYPSGLCAERVAVFNAGSNHPGVKILKIAITAGSDNYVVETPVPPCGACRQSLVEYEIKQESPVEIYFMGAKGSIMKSPSIQNLLPLTFDSSFL